MPTTHETLFDEIKRYVRFDESDARALAAFGRHASPRFRPTAEEFYERVREHEDAHAVFRDEAQIERLKVSLVRWMERLCAGPHDESYFLERAKIGRVHVKIGLPQRYMFTAMAVLRVSFQSIADELPEPDRAVTRQALARILDIELAIMLETYRDDFVARLQRVERIEKEALQRALAKSEHRYVSAVESAQVMIIGADAQGRIALFNREAERIVGRARDEVIGESFVDVLVADHLRPEAAERIARAAAGTVGEGAWETELVTRAGKRRSIAWQLAYAPHEGDDDVVLFAIGSDVTEERAREERTMRSEKLASIGTLAAGLAHEIRNPLNGALLHVTYLDRALRKQGAGEDAIGAVALVGDEIRRLSALVKDFLVFARPAPPELRATPLRVLGQRIAGLAAADAAAANVELITDWGGSELVLQLDTGKVEQAVLNLVRNAIEAIAGTGAPGHVTLRLRRQPRTAVIEIEDDGPGLASPDAPIFDAFFSTKPQGTGLGLAIVHRIVSDHGGNVTVDSKPGSTTFRITLPLEESS